MLAAIFLLHPSLPFSCPSIATSSESDFILGALLSAQSCNPASDAIYTAPARSVFGIILQKAVFKKFLDMLLAAIFYLSAFQPVLTPRGYSLTFPAFTTPEETYFFI